MSVHFVVYVNCYVNRYCVLCVLIKIYADDAVFTGLIADNDELDYRNNIDLFTNWCAENHLIIYIKKNKEIVFNLKENKQTVQPVKINDVSVVNEYKYLGTVIDSQLNWNLNTTKVYKKLINGYTFSGNLSLLM